MQVSQFQAEPSRYANSIETAERIHGAIERDMITPVQGARIGAALAAILD